MSSRKVSSGHWIGGRDAQDRDQSLRKGPLRMFVHPGQGGGNKLILDEVSQVMAAFRSKAACTYASIVNETLRTADVRDVCRLVQA